MRAAFAYECAAFAYPVIAHDISPRLSREFPPCPHIFTPARASAARSFAFFCGPPPPGRPALPRSDRAGLSPTRTFFTSHPLNLPPARANYVQPAQITSSLHNLPAAARLYFLPRPAPFLSFARAGRTSPRCLKKPGSPPATARRRQVRPNGPECSRRAPSVTLHGIRLSSPSRRGGFVPSAAARSAFRLSYARFGAGI